MVVKVYVSLSSGNKKMNHQQQHIKQILSSKGIDYEEIDICSKENDDEKEFMRSHSLPAGGQTVPLPPQIFADAEYCGDYDKFFDANEMEQLFEFLKMAEPKSVSQAAVTLEEN